MSDTAEKVPHGMVVVGRVLGPYGVRGWIHVAAFTEPKDNLVHYQPWLLAGADQADWQPVTVREVRAHKQGFVASLAGVDDRAAAERLKGRLIGVPESVLPEAAEGEYYWRDLVGARVTDPDGALIGRVDGLMETGAHDVLVVKRADGTELLIPFHARYVLGVDGDRISVDWPDETGPDNSDPEA